MSAKWIRIETDFVDHPKVARLAIEIGNATEADAGWYVMRAWSWLSRFCPTGHLRDSDGTAFEAACKWRGGPGELIAAFVRSEWLDQWDNSESRAGWSWHDWADHQGKVADKAAKERERKRAYREKKRNEAATPVHHLSHGTGVGTKSGRPVQRDVTGRDGTKRDVSSSYDDDGGAAPPPPSLGMLVFERFQQSRMARGWACEEPPSRDDLDAFLADVAEKLRDTLDGARVALEVAAKGYAKDRYWLARTLPWAGFVEQWRRHVSAPGLRETAELEEAHA